MRLGEFYESIVKLGMEKDPRPKKELQKILRDEAKAFKSLPARDKKYFDKERMKHPYVDTRILFGDHDRTIRNILVGIDIEGDELLMAQYMNERGAGIDLAMSHHPSGKALSNLHDVMAVHTSILSSLGLDEKIAKYLTDERIEEVARRVSSRNNERSVDIARLLNVPFMCVHTPADNHVASFLQKLFDKMGPAKVSDVMSILKSIPEYQHAMHKGAGPRVMIGKESNKAGKVFVDMTGGTEGSKKIFARLSQAGVGTIVGMHIGEEHFKAAKAEFINVVIAGHIASDTLGLNLILDGIVKKNDLNVIPCSGFVRVKR